MASGAQELEPTTAEANAGEHARAAGHALPPGAPCPNCGTVLLGPWCHACGQKGEEFHRSIWHLVAEAFEGLTHFDGRFWNTLPRLLARPGKLTRDYLEGHRASQIPPFRMFLVVLLAVFLAGSLNMRGSGAQFRIVRLDDPKLSDAMTPKQRADVERSLAQIKLGQGVTGQASRWVRDRTLRAVQDPEVFLTALEQWGHQFAILMLPISALLLSLLFLGKRDVYVFDHLIFSMHSLSFLGLLITASFLLGLAFDGAGWLLLAAPVHLFFHMRATYRASVPGTLARMFLLFVGSTVAFGLLIAGLLLVGLAATH